MALNNLGLGLVITAKDKASAVFQKVGGKLKGLGATGSKIGAGLGKIGMAVKGAALGFAPFSLAMGAGIKAAANFEQGMANVRTIMRDATEQEFTALATEAKRIGATTSFTAKQATEGMELLARAGFDAGKTLDATGAVIKAAEVEGINLATSAELISDNLNAFGLEANQAGKVAGTLALASAKTASSMVGLGEGLKFVAPTAKKLGIPIEDTVASLGMLANVGIKGSNAGTALNNMLAKLATASPETAAKFKAMGVTVKDANGDFVGMNSFLTDLNAALPGIGGNMDQVKFLAESMGLRGNRAASTLADAITKMGEDGKGSTNAFKELSDQLKGDTSKVLEDMAQDKLKSLEGSFKILGSSIEGVLIEGFTPMVKIMGPLVKEFADFIGEVAGAMDQLNQLGEGSKTAEGELAKMTPTIVAIAKGFKEGFDAIKKGIAEAIDFARGLATAFADAFGPGIVKDVVKFAVIFAGIAAVIAPVAMALVGVGYIISSVIIPAVGGLSAIAGAVFSPWGLAIAAVVGVLWSFRDQIVEFAVAAGARLMTFMDPVVGKLTAIWNNLKTIWTTFTSAFKSGATSAGASASELGDSVGNSIGTVITGVLSAVSSVVEGFKNQWVSMSSLFSEVGVSVKKVVDAVADLGAKIAESAGFAGNASGAWVMFGEVAAGVVGIVGAAIGATAEVLAGAVGIVTTVVDVVASVFGSAANILINIVNVIADLLAGNWSAAWQGAKTVVFEVVKAIIKVVTGMVAIIAGVVDTIGGIFGKDLGAKKFIEGVEADILKDTEKFFDQAEAAAKKAPKPAPAKPIVVPKVAPPAPAAVSAPQATQAFAGLAAKGASAEDIAAAVSKVKVGASIKLTSKATVNEAVLAEVMQKIQKDLDAKGAVA